MKNQKVKWGVIGCGGIADRRTIPELLKCNNTELIACMDRDGSVAEKVSEKYGISKSFDNVDDLLAQNIDAVYIASPVFCHEEQALAALKMGKHVLIEKPLALNSDSAKKIVDNFKKDNKFIVAGYMMRYHNLHNEIKRIISEGGIGQAVSLDLQFSCWYPKIAGSWRQDKTKGGGGAIMDLGVHCLDLINYFTDNKIINLKAIYGTQTQDYEVEDAANIIFRLENGAFCRILVNFNVPDALPSRIEIKGTSGELIAEGTLGQTETGRLEYLYAPQADYDAAQNNCEPVKKNFKSENGLLYGKQIEDFSRCIIKNNFDFNFTYESVNIQKIVETIYLEEKSNYKTNIL